MRKPGPVVASLLMGGILASPWVAAATRSVAGRIRAGACRGVVRGSGADVPERLGDVHPTVRERVLQADDRAPALVDRGRERSRVALQHPDRVPYVLVTEVGRGERGERTSVLATGDVDDARDDAVDD